MGRRVGVGSGSTADHAGRAVLAGTTIIRGDVLVESVRALKVEDGGDIVVPGSGRLVHALTAAQLVDRYQLRIHPVAVGNGKRLFAKRTGLRLIDARITATGLARS